MASRGNGNGPAQPLGRGTGRQSPPRRAVSEDIRVRPGRSGSLSTETTTGGHRGGLERSRTGSTGGVGKIFTGMAAAMRGAMRRSDTSASEPSDVGSENPRRTVDPSSPPVYSPLLRGVKVDHTLCVGKPGEAMPGKGTRIDVLSSQELLYSSDGSAALDHRSYSPANFYQACYRHEPVNMDRGCFGHCANGTNFGSVFDGVTAGGKINAYAAQAFAEYTYKFIIDKHEDFKQGRGVNELLARQMFVGAIDRLNNPVTASGKFEAEGGSATGIFIMFEPCGRGDYVIGNGASIGDTAAILCYAERCECRIISSTGFRRSDNARDTGGQLTMGMGIMGEIWNFSTPVGVNDLVILCTDGLMDNCRGSDVSVLLPVVIRCRAFDAYPAEVCPTVRGENPCLPSIADVLAYAGNPDMKELDAMPLPEPAIAVLRLSHYLAWVTMALNELENRYYGAELLCREEEQKRQALLSSKQPSKITDDPKATLKHITASIESIKEEQDAIHEARKTQYVGKTDDAIIVVISPLHKLGRRSFSGQ